MGGHIRESLRGAEIWALLLIGALLVSCEQAAGPIFPKPGEDAPEITEPEEKPEPVRYRAIANGVNGERDSTVIVFSFEEDVADLRTANISLANGGGDAGGSIFKGALTGGGKEWSLGITVQNPGTVAVAVNKEGVEEEEKPVAVFKAAEKILLSFNAAADGGLRRASSAINFTFGAEIADLAAEDITIAGDTGSVTTGALTGSGQIWSLGIAVETPGDIWVGIAREGIETGERLVTVYKPASYSVTADGGDGESASSKIEFTFTAGIAGLTAEDISVTPADSVTVGSLAGSGASWTLGITALKAGEAQVKIHKDGIEDSEKALTLYLYDKPLGYAATANGVNGKEDSTAIALVFEEDVEGLRAGQISLAEGEGESGGKALRGALSGNGKQWSLGITVEKAGSIGVAIGKAGIEAAPKTVTVYKAGEQALVSFSAAADGGARRASTAINFSFGAAVAGLTAEDIVLINDTGSVTKGTLSGEGQHWSLRIAVETPGNIRANINRAGIEAGQQTVTVYKPATYSITTDGTADLAASTKIDFLFNADIAGLTTGDISISPGDSVAAGALSGGGTSWSLGITTLRAGEIRVRINKDGVEDREKTLTLSQHSPAGYAAAVNGANGTEDSTAIVFSFDKDIADLAAEHISLANGTGSVTAGSLSGSGRQWSLGIAVQKAGSVRVAINKAGIEAGERTLDLHKAGESILISFTAAADGSARKASAAITLNFGKAVSLAGADIAVTAGTGGIRKGALSGNGRTWSLGITVETPGDITVSITKDGIEAGEKSITVYKPVAYDAMADGGGAEPSGRIDFVFDEAVYLSEGDIRLADDTGSASSASLLGAGNTWSLVIETKRTGNIRVSVYKDGIEDGEKTVAVYKPEETEVVVKTGITVIKPPDTVLYARNQPFDRTGLEIGWVYSDGSVEPMPGGYQVAEPTPEDMGISTNKRIKVTAGGYETGFWIQVLSSDKVLTHISVEGPANKTQDLGKEFDRTGLVVTGHYSDGSTSNNLASLAAIVGYSKYRRGPQTANVVVNGKTAALEGITTRIGEGAAVLINRGYYGSSGNIQETTYRNIYVKGEAMTLRGSNIKVGVYPSGPSNYADGFLLTPDDGSLTEQDFATLSGYNPYQTGWQLPSITVDGRQVDFDVRVVDVEPAVWFDYGYMRHDGDPTGHGPGAGKYYAKPNETLVIVPVRYLLGYNADHSDAGASYSWTVSGDSGSRTYETTGNGGEMLRVTPKTAGTYTITVAVTGRDYAGSTTTKTATTELVCYAAPLPKETFNSPLRNFGPGQFATGGNGYGWSLGSAGGYEIWTVDHQASYEIRGNPFIGWEEPGVVWMQEDNNGNGLPDEMWHELRGGDDDDPAWRNYITRRYAVTYVKGDGTPAQHWRVSSNAGVYVDPRVAYWIDSKGRTGMVPGGFPNAWGVTGDWATYTCTLLRDNGQIATGEYGGLSAMYGYADASNSVFHVKDAMRADGVPANLSAVKFIKVQTGVFRYGGIFGDVSTEIKYADGLGQQSDFPDP
jgi:hypothetical protein